MRAIGIIWLLAALAVASLPAQAIRQSVRAVALGEPVTVLDGPVVIPAQDLRRVSLPSLLAGAEISVDYRAESQGSSVELEILQRQSSRQGVAIYRHVRRFPLSSDVRMSFRIPEAGAYVIAVRQGEGARLPLRANLHVQVRQPVASPRIAAVRILSTEKRIAVAIFSLAFLWTTIIVCGVPIIRAFRHRKTRGVPPWYV